MTDSTQPQTQHRTHGRLGRCAWLPIPLLLAVIVGLWVADLRTVYESRALMVLLNLFFTGLASLCICILTARGFLGNGQPGLLMFGCGSLLWGVTSLAAAVVVDRVNPTITVHNLGILGAAVCHLIGLLWRGRLPRPGRWLVAGYAAALLTAALIFRAAMAGWTPLFFVQGQGGTLIREIVLLGAIAMFAWVAWQMIGKFWRQDGTFYYWYGLGLALVATGLTGVMVLTVKGGILGWTNRMAQYLGSAYLFIAALMAARGTALKTFSLTELDEALKTDGFTVGFKRQSSARWFVRYGLAVVAVAATIGLRLAMTAWVGPGLPTYITITPTVMVVALLAGLGPGLLATALTDGVVAYWFLPPVGQFAIASPVDRLGLVIATGMGLFMSVVAELYQRNRDKAAAYDREAALRESEERFRTMFEGHGAPMLLIEPGAGDIVDANQAASAFYGYSREQLRAMRINQINQLPPEEVAARRQNAIDLTETQFIFPHRLADGQVRWVEVYSSPVSVQGRPMLFSIIHDVTQKRRVQDALQAANLQLTEADKRKNEFLAMLAHELRNPLAPIRNAVQIIKLAGANESVREKNRAIIDRQASHMGRLLDDLLEVSRVTRGSIALKIEPLELRTIVMQAVEAGSHAAQARNLEIHYTHPLEPIWLEGDFTRLEQVVGNLINNAIKYSDVGQIQVSVGIEPQRDGDGPWAVVRVRDTGIGISPEMLPRVFELFAQADQSLERTRGGLGIGLTMVKRLVELHHGRVEARSDGLGKGSEFSVLLPFGEKALPEETPAVQPSGPNGHEKNPLEVLVVDDNQDSAGSLKELLEMWGYKVYTAFDGQEAIQLACAFVPDVILLDIGLPGMSGYAVARKLREERSLDTVRIIALTGYGQDEDRKMTSEAGFDAHMVKPVDLHHLQIMLGRIMVGD